MRPVRNEYVSVEERKKLKRNVEPNKKPLKEPLEGGEIALEKICLSPRVHLPTRFPNHHLLATLPVNSVE